MYDMGRWSTLVRHVLETSDKCPKKTHLKHSLDTFATVNYVSMLINES